MYEVNAAPILPSTSTVAQDCRLYGSERHVEWSKLGLKLGTKEWKLRRNYERRHGIQTIALQRQSVSG